MNKLLSVTALTLVTVGVSLLSTPAHAQRYDNDMDALREFGTKLPAVTEVLGQAIQISQDCGMASSDMQGTQHAYFTILSTSTTIAGLRTLSPDIKKLWPSEADFKAAFKRGQESSQKTPRTPELCAQVREKFPPIDIHQEEYSRSLALRLKEIKTKDDAEADARIKAGHSPTDAN